MKTKKISIYCVPSIKQSTKLDTFKYIILLSILLDIIKCFITTVLFTLEIEAIKDKFCQHGLRREGWD